MKEQKTIAYIRTSDIYNDSRATKEINTLIAGGYRIIVFGWDRSGEGLSQCEKVFAGKPVKYRFFNKKIAGGIGFKNLFKLLAFIKWTYKQLKRNRQEIDFVHACDLDAGIPAKKFCKKFSKKLVYDIYDYYIDSHSMPSIFNNFIEKLEINVINFASKTIICTEERREQIQKAQPKDICVIVNSPKINTLSAGFNKFDYVYCGALSEDRLLNEILNEYHKHSDLAFQFAGYGRLQEQVESVAQEYESFKYVGAVPYEDVLTLESEARVISAIYKPTLRNHRLCAPNKFYEALALGKPLIVCRGTGIDQVVEKYEIGIVIDYDAQQFYEALKQLKMNDQLCEEMGQRARKLYEEKYKWSLMENKLLELYQSL